MNIRKINDYKENTPITVNLENYVVGCLKYTEFCLNYVKDKYPLSYKKYCDKFSDFLKSKENIKCSQETILNFLKTHSHFLDNLYLGRFIIVKIIELLGITDISDLRLTITVDVKPYLKGYLFLNYYLAKSLASIMPLYDSIECYKKIRDGFTQTLNLQKFEKVSEFVFKEYIGAFKNGFIMTEFIIDEGRSGVRVDKCRWAEVVKELNDPDFAYIVCCHFDFEAAKMRNPAFVLTRNGTIIQGKSYCDFIWHDTRLDKEVKHPGKEFWDSL